MKAIHWLFLMLLTSTFFTIHSILGMYSLVYQPYSVVNLTFFMFHVVGFLVQFTAFSFTINEFYEYYI